jgi:predicted O-methyltransferase YrrM
MTDWEELLGCTPDEYCRRIYAKRPSWVTGIVSLKDSQFLFGRVLAATPAVIIEVGTASGVSTVVLCHAAEVARRGGEMDDGFRVVSYDIHDEFYADTSRATGDAARAMLAPELLDHVEFQIPGVAATAREQHEENSIGFAFIDASHAHPWPTLDLLALLPILRPGADVALHDINLPERLPDMCAGAKWLFDDLTVEKVTDHRDPMPNIGAVTIPADKAGLREQLLGIMEAHEWEVSPHPKQLEAALD